VNSIRRSLAFLETVADNVGNAIFSWFPVASRLSVTFASYCSGSFALTGDDASPDVVEFAFVVVVVRELEMFEFVFARFTLVVPG